MRGTSTRTVGATSGTILIFTLWVLALLSIMATTLITRVRFEQRLVDRAQHHLMGRENLLALGQLFTTQFPQAANGGVAEYKNFLIPLMMDAGQLGPQGHADASFDGGVVLECRTIDESGKININFLLALAANADYMDVLQNLIERAGGEANSLEIAQAILDWWDADDVGQYEADAYRGMGAQYIPPNKDFTILEDLLFVAGVSRRLYDGEDANHNGILDPEEDDGDILPPADNADGQLQLGLRGLFTVYGDGRININGVSPDLLDALMARCVEPAGRIEAVENILQNRRGRDGLDKTDDDHFLESEDDIIALLGESTYSNCLGAGIEFVTTMSTAKGYFSVFFPEKGYFSRAEMIVTLEDDNVRVAEWREW